MSFSFNTGIPATADNPSNDQPIMQQNNVATSGILGVDHITFNANNGGTHTHVTFVAPQSTPGLSPSQSQIYPQTFNTGASAYLENYISATNPGGTQTNGYLPFVKCITHFKSIGVNGPITADPGYINANIGSIVQSNGGKTITVNFATALFSSVYYIFQTFDSIISPSVTPVTTSTSSIIFASGAIIPINSVFSFMVI
jgi:hypothetical protein